MLKLISDVKTLDSLAKQETNNAPYKVIPNSVNLFVYGTLKPGFHNYEIVRPYALQVVPASFQGAIMYNLGVGFPAIVLDRRCKSIIRGYVITLPEKSPGLEDVDRLEGHIGPKCYNHYEKSRIYNVLTWDGIRVTAWVYHYTRAKAEECGTPHGRGEWTRADYLDRDKAGRISKSVADRFSIHRKEQEKNWGNL